jgi:WD40 repeat protein/transcriptional regulator with XRE-family HTH domain
MPHTPDEPDPDARLEITTRAEFGAQLALLREQAGLTVRDVAKMVNMAPATLGGYFAGRHLPPVKPPDVLRTILVACGLTQPARIAEWEATLRRIRRAPGKRPAGLPVPFRGLETFQPEDAEWFHGREELTWALVSRLRAGQNPLIVVGPSGSGKSSLLRAGLIPALRPAGAPDPKPDVSAHVLLTPTSHPLTELAGRLAALHGADLDVNAVATGLRDDPRSISAVIARVTEAGPRPEDRGGLLIVVDQFEEVFTAGTDLRERQAFITALFAARPRTFVVLGLRADFYDQALRHPELAAALQRAQVVVGPMTEAELRRAIIGPARQASSELEDGLVELLLRDLAPTGDRTGAAGHDPGSLPLLSHALLATWERGHRRRLTIADYQLTGGIRGAVARSAEDVHAELTVEQRAVARQIFLRLVHVSDDVADTRRRTSRSELPFPSPDSKTVLDRFISQRLITVNQDRVEISHEALLSAWPRLRGWIDADRAGLHTHRQLTAAAEAWHDTGRDPHALYRGGRLLTAREWAVEPSHRAALNRREQAFIDASVEHEAADSRAAKRRNRRLRQLVAALTALAVATGVLAVNAYRQSAAADRQRDIAISRQLATVADQLRSTDVSLGIQLSLAAYRIAPTAEARSGLLESFTPPASTRILGPPGVLQSVVSTVDGRMIVTAGADFRIRLFSLADPGHPTAVGTPLDGHTNTIFSLALSPDARILASGSGDRTVRLWDVSRPQHAVALGVLTDPTNTVYSVAFSPDGRTLAGASADGTVHLWDLTNPAGPRTLATPLPGTGGYLQSVAFSPDGHMLAAGTADDAVLLWNITDPQHPAALGPPLTGPAKAVFSVAFSPDGNRLAAGSADNKLWLWDLPDRGRARPSASSITGPKGWINGVRFSPDGHRIAAASSDGKVWLYDADTRQTITTLPHPGPVTAVQFVGDGDRLVTSSGDGLARIWQLPGPVIPSAAANTFNVAFGGNHTMMVEPDDNTVTLWDVRDARHPRQLGPTINNTTVTGRASGAATISPDGRTLAIGTADGSVQLWDVTDPAHPMALPTRLTAHTQGIQAITFSPSGRVLGISSNDHNASLWDVTAPRRPTLLAPPLTGPANYTYSPSFSPDGRIFAVGTADNKIWLWDVSDLHHPAVLGPPLTGPTAYAFTVQFSPDGHTLAVGSADNTVRLWDISDPRRPTPLGTPLLGPEDYVTAIAFSGDGRTLAAAGGDGTIWLWGLDDHRRAQVLATLTGSPGSVFTAVFDGDTDTLASGGADQLVHLWNTDPDYVATYICSVAGSPITPAEWTKYVPGLPYRQLC